MNRNAINQSSKTVSLEHYSLLENYKDDSVVTTQLTVCKASEAFKAVEEFIEKSKRFGKTFSALRGKTV